MIFISIKLQWRKYLMKFTLSLVCLLFLSGCCLNHHHYSIYRYDNGNDHISEGMVRIIDNRSQKIGYATSSGKIIIPPQYAFGYPFKNGKAKVTYFGNETPVPNSNGEYHYWKSNDWFYIDKKGKRL